MSPARCAPARLAVLAAALAAAVAQLDAQPATDSPIELVTLETPRQPIVAVRLMFRAGSVADPAGKEGLAALTGLMVGQAGTARRAYAELVDALYPMAGRLDVSTDREVTVIAGQIHREKLDEFTTLLEEVLLEPGFREEDFTRNREQLLAYLTTTLRSGSDELLGLELLQQRIFHDHPYGHAAQGTVAGLKNVTLDDVRAFYQRQFTRSQLVLGVAGGYPSDYPARLQRALARLPRGEKTSPALPPPPRPDGRELTIVDKRTDSVGIHFGYALPVTRADGDYYPLMVANSFLGEHRTFHGRLMQQLRGLRGLNYGDYSYVEHWANPPGTFNPSPNVPRRQQYFSVWVRPVAPAHALFAVRNALFEVNRLIERGVSDEEFRLTRDFLVSYSKLWARGLSDRLGFHMDGRFYGTPYFIDEIERRLAGLTAADVNLAIKKYLQTERFQGVLVASGAQGLAAKLKEDAPSPIEYANPVPPDVTESDKTIARVPIRATSVRVVPVAEVFEK